MFTRRFSLTSVGRRLGAVALGLASIGLGLSFAQDRGRVVATNPPPQPPQTADRPTRTVDRPPAREVGERPVHRGTESRSSGSREQQVNNQGRVTQNKNDRADEVQFATHKIIAPRRMERCTGRPTADIWRVRDITGEIQYMARRGFVAVHPVGEDVNEFKGFSEIPAGWKAYGFRVPAGESIQVRLNHTNEGWFRLLMVDKWGGLEQGMLQNVVHTYEPFVTYKNPTKATRSVYVIADDPGWMSSESNPFSMTITRSWDPAQKKVDDVQYVTGIWAVKK